MSTDAQEVDTAEPGTRPAEPNMLDSYRRGVALKAAWKAGKIDEQDYLKALAKIIADVQ